MCASATVAAGKPLKKALGESRVKFQFFLYPQLELLKHRYKTFKTLITGTLALMMIMMSHYYNLIAVATLLPRLKQQSQPLISLLRP
jgi:hypothetical protein